MRPDLLLLFNREYWLDEWHTLLVANRPDVAQVIGDLRNGSDFAPPFVHLTLWTLRVLTGGGALEPWIARSFTLACAIAAIWFVYAALRRHFDRTTSLAGSLAVASHAMVVSYAFEARFYAPWLMFAAMFAWSLDARPDRRRLVVGALAAVGLCTTHWFGVVTLGLMSIAAFACQPERAGVRAAKPKEGPARQARANRAGPALAGGVALLLCIPLLLGQRASVQERSWLQELSWRQFAHLANTYWLALIPIAALAAIGVACAMRETRPVALEGLRTLARNPSLAALLTLAAMPVALAVLSLLQPVMLDRYALTALLAWAPLVAVAVHRIPLTARVIAIVLLSVRGLAAIGGQVGIERQVSRIVARDRAILREQCARRTVAFTTRLQMYYHLDFIRRECPGARYVAIANDRLDRLYHGANERVQRQFRSENEFAELHRQLYGYPQVIASAALDSLDHFVVMAEPSTVPRDGAGRELFSPIMFPYHRPTPLNGNGVLYER
jgi:hypothetical protein